MTSTTTTAPETQECVRLAAKAALDRKAVDLRILDLEPVSDFTDYFMVCSATNDRQVQAIASSIEKVLRPLKVRPMHIEGLKNAQWVLLDYGTFLVHIFDHERRKFYGLERLWADAADVTDELCQ
ncbi:MAG: ribosome silencing factor [Deltaproteobacteria bacterium]|nr:ribosome silencing factor [Deltaproteobacteria bacterium]